MRSRDSLHAQDFGQDTDGADHDRPSRLPRRVALESSGVRTRSEPELDAPMAARSFGDAVNAGIHGAVQLDSISPVEHEDPARVHAIASAGMKGTGGPLPHLETIQRSFGHHDVGGVKAHVGGPAADAAAAIGAHGYASGDQVAFAGEPDLHLAAHEAAHVVQQRGGVRLSDGIGRSGDTFEQHADAVADAVVRGDSAEALLDQHAHRGAAGGSAVQLQRRPGGNLRGQSSDELVARARQLDAELQGMEGPQQAQTARTLVEIHGILQQRIDRGEFQPHAQGDADPIAGILEGLAPFGNIDHWIVLAGEKPRKPPARRQRQPQRGGADTQSGGDERSPAPSTPQSESAQDMPPEMTVRADDGWHASSIERAAHAESAIQAIRRGMEHARNISRAEFPRGTGDTRVAGTQGPEIMLGYMNQMHDYLFIPNMPHNFRDDLTSDALNNTSEHRIFPPWRRGTQMARRTWNGMTPQERRAVRTDPYRGQANGVMRDAYRAEEILRAH